MIAQLTGLDAYMAGVEDASIAIRNTEHAVKTNLITEADREAFYKKEFQHLLLQRIERGELPSLTSSIEREL